MRYLQSSTKKGGTTYTYKRMHPSFDMVEFQTVSSIALCCAANYSENREHCERPDREEITSLPVYYPVLHADDRI